MRNGSIMRGQTKVSPLPIPAKRKQKYPTPKSRVCSWSSRVDEDVLRAAAADDDDDGGLRYERLDAIN